MMQHHPTMSSPPQQFCLRWNNYQSNLTNVFDQLLQSEAFVDVTLACDGHSVKAHKMVLSACSPYFQTLFFENPCRHPIVILKDIKWPELKAVVEFMYRGEINVLQEQIGPLLKVAETLKIRGLADVNNEMDSPVPVTGHDTVMASPSSSHGSKISAMMSNSKTHESHRSYWPSEEDPISLKVPVSSSSMSSSSMHHKKRRRGSGGERSTCSSISSPEEAASAAAAGAAAHMELLESVAAAGGLMEPAVAAAAAAAVAAAAAAAAGLSPPSGTGQDHCLRPPGTPELPPPTSLPLPPPPPPSSADDMEIKPGIAEMILEEERAKLLESSHAWLGASTSSITDSYQYQLQSMWQKCWNTNQSLVHNLRFRERGPLKSWRPETMAEAIFSVLKEGLSLSQAARKYDIPYPTFVLYANRVHNMLGPSADGGADLRPKGRGRPQRILLGVWPEEHIRGVIRAVVFRDPQNIKEEAQTLARLYCLQDPLSQSPQGYSTSNGPGGDSGSRSVTPTPGSAAAAAVAAVAQGLRQQMCGLAAGGEGGSQQGPNAAAAAAALASAILGREAAESMQHASASLNNNTLSALMNNGVPRNLGLGNVGVGGMPYKPGMFAPPRPENLFQEDIEDIVKSPLMDSMDESDSMHQQVKSDQVLEASAD